jgi:hypothetical protein
LSSTNFSRISPSVAARQLEAPTSVDATFAASILESRKFDELEAKFVVMLS